MAGSHRPRVLVLDSQLRHSIAIVRSLGRKGVEVICAAPNRLFPSRVSRFAAGSRVLRYDTASPLDDLLSIIERESIDVVIPAGLPGNELICRHRDVLSHVVRGPYNHLAGFERLANKLNAVELARVLGVPCPRTAQVSQPDRLDNVVGEIAFPVVFKSAVDQGTVRYARNAEELRVIAEAFWRSNRALIDAGRLPLAQEYVQGTGHGYYALADNGRVIAHFLHRRLHEVPASGGPSSMAVSYRDPELTRLGERFVTETAWTGVLMVEFRKSAQDGRYYLMEVNPKFWGSLDLSIAAGVDFPWLLYETLAYGSASTERPEYRDGCIYRWLTMDLAYAVETRQVGAYFRTFANRRVRDDFVRDDPLPLMMLFGVGFNRQIRSLLRGGRGA
jgi:predicted ATP-grasp superfamily ATP-dependent carboligase